MLAISQDMDGLPARVAFHLSRLGIGPGHPALRHEVPRQWLRDVASGLLDLSERDVAALAVRLELDVLELVRPLTQKERDAWSFFMTSASNHRLVWAEARSLWRSRGLTDKAAARLLGMSTTALSHTLNGRHTRILDLDAANKLAEALSIVEGPRAFLPNTPITRERGVSD